MTGEACLLADALEEQRTFLKRINPGQELPAEHLWVQDLFMLAEAAKNPKGPAGRQVRGRVTRVVLRGKEAFRDGKVLAEPGYGRNIRV
jgi:hypothetical protein